MEGAMLSTIHNIPSYELRMTSTLIDPTFIARMQRAASTRTTVDADGSMTIHSERLVFADKTVSMTPGTEVEVSLGFRSFSCSIVADIEAFLAQKRAEELKEKERERIRRNKYREESIALNSNLSIPVKWFVGIKDVLSGLSANSWGDGRMKSTVEHVYLLEDLQAGRFKRSAHDFLCGNSKSRWGGRYTDSRVEWEDGDGNLYEPKVTCKTCLSIAERLGKKTGQGKQ
jgi:hypothetical protein